MRTRVPGLVLCRHPDGRVYCPGPFPDRISVRLEIAEEHHLLDDSEEVLLIEAPNGDPVTYVVDTVWRDGGAIYRRRKLDEMASDA
jgi:hypothetical protein